MRVKKLSVGQNSLHREFSFHLSVGFSAVSVHLQAVCSLHSALQPYKEIHLWSLVMVWGSLGGICGDNTQGKKRWDLDRCGKMCTICYDLLCYIVLHRGYWLYIEYIFFRWNSWSHFVISKQPQVWSSLYCIVLQYVDCQTFIFCIIYVALARYIFIEWKYY